MVPSNGTKALAHIEPELAQPLIEQHSIDVPSRDVRQTDLHRQR
jgi:hypothetical protein